MDLTNPAELFQFSNTLALPGWIWLCIWLFLPDKLQRKTRYGGLILPLTLSLIYASSAIVHLGSASGGFDSLANVQSLFQYPGATLVGWVHYLAFDLFVGWIITQHSVANQTRRGLVVPCLILCFMLGPVGLFLYGCIQVTQFVTSRYAMPSQDTHTLWRNIVQGQGALAKCGLILLGVLPIFVLAYLMDTRTVLEFNVWTKPIKFATALAAYTLTLSWYCNYLSPIWRASRWFNGFTIIVVCAITVEMLWLVFAAAIGQPSHFNLTHPVLKPTYPLMGVVAVILTGQSLVVGVGILRYKTAKLKDLTHYGLGYGLIATFFLTLITAGYMSGAPAQSHAVLAQGASSINEANSVLFLGWLHEAGDLRVAHFFSTHALHFVPLVAWLTAMSLPRPSEDNSRQHKGVAIALTALYSAFVFLTFSQALSGRPFL